jgi:hypothetical protein
MYPCIYTFSKLATIFSKSIPSAILPGHEKVNTKHPSPPITILKANAGPVTADPWLNTTLPIF